MTQTKRRRRDQEELCKHKHTKWAKLHLRLVFFLSYAFSLLPSLCTHYFVLFLITQVFFPLHLPLCPCAFLKFNSKHLLECSEQGDKEKEEEEEKERKKKGAKKVNLILFFPLTQIHFGQFCRFFSFSFTVNHVVNVFLSFFLSFFLLLLRNENLFH